jgi:hypothetical protein
MELLNVLKKDYERIDAAAESAASNSIGCYDVAAEAMKEELESILDEYNKNINMIREINKNITSSINSWYDYMKDEKAASKLTFPIAFYLRKKKLYKEIEAMNNQISEFAINNRFLKEKLTSAKLELEVRAVSLAHKGDDYNEYEKLLTIKDDIEEELKYLLPTIHGICPADITITGIDKTIETVKKTLLPL